MNRFIILFLILTLNVGCGISQDNEEVEEAPTFMDQEVEEAPTFMDQEIESAPIPQPKKRVENAYNEARHIELAKQKNIQISKIYYGHNKTGITAIIVDIAKKQSEAQLLEMQEKLNTVFPNYRQAVLQTLVNYKGKPFAMITAKKHYSEPWEVVYFYKDIKKPLEKKVKALKAFMETSEKLKGHELINVYYPIYSLPKDKSTFPTGSLIVFTKKGDNYYRFNHYDDNPGKLWTYRLEGERYYSTDERSDPQVQIKLENGDLVNISLYYFQETDERYGSYFLKLD